MPRRLISILCTIGILVLLRGASVSAAPVTLNLKDADIESLVGTISGITGKNFIVDPRVKGKVTVIASHPMDEKEVYEVFLSVLRVHGFAAVPTGDVIKIVPEANAKQDSIPMAGGDGETPGRDQAVTLVIPLENVTAAQLVPVLRPLVPPQGHLAAYAPTNVLIVSDRAANVDRLKRIIERVDLASEEDVEIVRLEHASAGEVVRILGTLTQRGQQQPGEATSQVRTVADDRTNSIIISGERATRMRYRALIAHLDTPLETQGNTQVIYLRYAKAVDLVPVLQGVSAIQVEVKGGESQQPASQTRVDIQADEATNALIVTAPPDTMRTLRQVINQLDIRRAQVLVEAVVADISVDKAAQLGVSWVASTENGRGPIGVINLNDALAVASGLIGPLDDLAVNAAGTLAGYGDFGGDSQWAVLVRALDSDSDTNVLSTPSLLTLDNEEAEIVVAENVPFVTGQFTNTGAGDSAVNPFQTIERQDVGITLRIKPQINEGNSVNLKITQEVSQVRSAAVQEAVGASDIVTTKRSVQTTVLAEDGQVIVLGGLIDENTRIVENKVPVLGDIPLVGYLFKDRESQKVKTNLMIFIRPVIMREPGYANQVSSRKYAYIREEQLRTRPEDGIPLMREEQVEVLPTLEEIEEENGIGTILGENPAPAGGTSQSAPAPEEPPPDRSWHSMQDG